MSNPQNRDMACRIEKIKKISKKAANILREKCPNEEELFGLTEEDLKKFYPDNGKNRDEKRKKIMRLIEKFKQAKSVGDEPRTETSEQSVSELQLPSKFKKPVKVHVLVAGETFGTHETFMKKLKFRKVQTQMECKVILLFCPVASRIGTDMETAMARVTEDKPVILVFMHHCHSPSQMINITVQPCRSNIVKTVHCAFLETNGLLRCEENKQAIEAVRSKLKEYKKETK